MKTIIYARISTSNKGQNADNQINVLKEYCEKMNYDVVHVYKDEVSGGTSDRPAFKQLFKDASKRKFDLVLFWSLDRWSREGTRATIKSLEMLEQCGVAYKSYTEQYIDSCGIFKDVVISLLATLSAQEKVRISERVRAGLARSVKQGGRPKLDSQLVTRINKMKQEGLSNRKIGQQLKISHSTVGQYISQVIP
jgi:DNA invertase Pin-like site-specific DNA recombinase